MNVTRFISSLLLIATASLTGCSSTETTLFLLHPINETFARHSNPIEGWKSIGEVGCKKEEMSAEIFPIPGYKEISDDVQKFVNKLPVDHGPSWDPSPRRWCFWIEDVRFYEDGTGQHAVAIQILHDGTSWGYVLIYDKHNKRVKAVRYVQGYYMC